MNRKEQRHLLKIEKGMLFGTPHQELAESVGKKTRSSLFHYYFQLKIKDLKDNYYKDV